jgi:predicted amidophosphoribosyltransferase
VLRCRECSGRRLAFASARAAVAYDGTARLFVSAWKERGLRRLAACAAVLVTEQVPRPDVAVVTFVPPDGDRSLRRGHHPPERLACELARAWALPVEPLLGRTREVKQQRGLQRDERRANIRGAFTARTAVPPRVALVDDVYTSGATANAAASALRAGGARRVRVVTFARALRAG